MAETGQSIVIGLRLDKSDETLLNAARTLAERWNLSIEAVHTIPPIFEYLTTEGHLQAHIDQIRQFEEQRSKKLLEELSENSPLGMHTHLLFDFPSEALLTIAAETHAKLIICGLRIEEDQNLTSGFTTAFTLAAEASVPVLVIPIGSGFAFGDKLNVLVADNLEVEGRLALEGTLGLAQNLPINEIHHVFVHDVRPGEINRIAKSIKEARQCGMLPANIHFSKDSFLELVQRKTEEELVYRIQNCQHYQDYQGSYRAHVAFGPVARRLRETALHSNTQLLILGRRSASNHKMVTFGKVPYQVMVDRHYATLVIPEKVLRGTHIQASRANLLEDRLLQPITS